MNMLLARHNMVAQQIKPVGVLNPRIIEIMANCPREIFVPAAYQEVAYADAEIPLGNGRIMLAPNIIGRLLQALNIQQNQEVLVVEAGSGYLTALVAQLGLHVTSFETNKSLAIQANKKLAALGIKNYEVINANANDNLQGKNNFDVIILTESMQHTPRFYNHYLKPGGKLFAVVGHAPVMHACIFTRISEEEWSKEILFETNIPSLRETIDATSFEF